jgi:sugar phosphate isomerase/epimerase
MVYLIDPLPQIRKWASKIFHVHGKDATIRWDVIANMAFSANIRSF